jgi:hypothetical protein
MRRLAPWTLGLLLAGLIVIAAAPHDASWAQSEPGLNRITQVQPGMTMLQVLQTLGAPTDIVGHTFIYKELGKVVFASKASPLDATKVEKIEPNPVQNPVP